MPTARLARALRCLLAFLASLPAAATAAGVTSPALDLAAVTAAWRRPDEVAFSPDGRGVAFTVWRHVLEEETSAIRGEVWSAAVDGGRARPLTPPATDAWTPRWSPDGAAVAFLSAADGIDAYRAVWRRVLRAARGG